MADYPVMERLTQKVHDARALREIILAHRASTDAARQIAQPVVEAMAGLGLFRALVPASAGGEEWDLPTWLRVVEELSTVDGAVGWVAGVGGSVNAVVSGWLSNDTARTVFCNDAIGLAAGTLFPGGRATPTAGGYLVSGQWPFASSAPHAAWFHGGVRLTEAAGSSTPNIGRLEVLFPARDVELIDTWAVGGMRGTGSYDFAVREVFVPAAHVFNTLAAPPQHPGPLYRLPVRLTLSAGLGPLALGIARGAIDTCIELMTTKVDRRTGASLRDRMTVQERVAQAEAAVRAARTFFYEMVHEVWGTVAQGTPLTARQVALFQLSTMHAVASGAQAVDLVYRAAGTSAIFTTNLLERFFRDIHVATQHGGASPEEMYQVGRVLLGVREDTDATRR